MSSNTIEMDNIIMGMPKTIFILYLIISGNFMASLFGCRTQELLANNMFMKHILGFMTMFFFIVLVDSNSAWSNNPKTQLLFTLIFYAVFLITTRMDYKWWIAFILLLSTIYILQIYKEHKDTTEDEKEKYELYQKYLIYITGFIIFAGFIIYYGRKKKEYGSSFDHLKFLLGKPQCSFNREPQKMTDFDAIKTIFGKY
jgi:hypothetical protein